MEHISSTEARNNFAEIIDRAQKQPIFIQKQMKDVAVMISIAEYDKLRRIKAKEFMDLCDSIGKEAKKRGLTEAILADILADKE